ncbi:MAG: RNA methyltransferase [Chitinophagaceae bacterium]|nr:RNA methyltransferase [Chitinophagaceae bacterium]MBK8607499.1 RNA methyltransferase [Chitinophagaceae bacterium]MBP6479155.1 RNA methyltransferase [Chitinophagaceae bacterium]MBP7108416.1 RNA methyltransferase [Chitinophagaceae bacterium]MBP7313851.1 RNA methyltransferase [Chitinophagaceae bacterium]
MLSKSKLKYIQSLGQKKFRQQEGLFIAEGPKLVNDLLEMKNSSIQEIFALKEWIEDNKKIADSYQVVEITAIELEKISQLSSPNQVVAVVKKIAIDENIQVKGKFTLVLDNIQDPGNMGTIIRIADWYGIDQIVCNTQSADMYNPKVIQSTMGSIARVKVFYTDLSDWLSKQKGISIYAAMLNGDDVTSMQKIKEGIIVIGNESKGISDDVLKLVSKKITIPQKGKAESLNAAVATGIILSHLL